MGYARDKNDFDYRSALRAAERHLGRAEKLAEALGAEGARATIAYHRLLLGELQTSRRASGAIAGQTDLLTALRDAGAESRSSGARRVR